MLGKKLTRRFKRKFSSSATHLAVRPYVAWYVRWAIIMPFVFIAATLVWWAYDSGLEFAGFHRGQAERELSELRGHVAALTEENSQLSGHAASFERQAQIEHAANMETARQLQLVNEENIRLKEDLTLFENLTLSGTREGEVSIRRFKVERDTLPGEYRYRLLLVQGGQQRAKPFQGNLQLLVNMQHNGERSVVVFPQENPGIPAESAEYQLNFKYYKRIERSFRLPEDASVESIQIRIFERGTTEPKVKQDTTLS